MDNITAQEVIITHCVDFKWSEVSGVAAFRVCKITELYKKDFYHFPWTPNRLASRETQTVRGEVIKKGNTETGSWGILTFLSSVSSLGSAPRWWPDDLDVVRLVWGAHCKTHGTSHKRVPAHVWAPNAFDMISFIAHTTNNMAREKRGWSEKMKSLANSLRVSITSWIV